MQGYIGLHRKLMENPVWSDPNYLKLWIYCLFKASHKEHDQLLGNQIVKIERGQFVTGRKVLAADMNKGVKPDQMLSEKSWERYLKNLGKWQMLTIKVTNKYSVVTIDNYDVYQSPGGQVDQVVDQQLTNKSPAIDQQLTTNNNVNKGNNDKNDIKDNIPFVDIIDYLNLKAGTKYKPSGKKTRELIGARWKDKFILGDFKKVIDIKVAEWKGTDYEKYLRPETLFGTKFESYLNQKGGGFNQAPKQKVDVSSIFDEFKNMED